ncbi:MAG: deoxyribodipyrimidine photo-lyase [Gammaproteobacteria bacterium]|nr:deoxyribodipyrimidine photo-lyase [Gammaproteobacteria bacterium]
MLNMVWFRRDLRIEDNPALSAACQRATAGVIALFIMTPETWLEHGMAPIQTAFLLENLRTLSTALKKKNIPLLIREVPAFKNIPALLENLIQSFKVEGIFCNRQYEWDERQRDLAVKQKLKKLDCRYYEFDDQVIIPPDKILNQQGEPFKVFTPYKRKWLSLAETLYSIPLSSPKQQMKFSIESDVIPEASKNFLLPTAGERAAEKRLITFCQKSISHYHISRDFPAKNATSHLSADLALGILSPRQCLSRVMFEEKIVTFNDFFNKTGAAVWVSELIWREFYKMILFQFPRVSRSKAFQLKTDKIPWRHDEKSFKKWCEGMTGFPLVDAAMRQLNETGWMHNRLRMLTAMFLTKILLIDWRWGERYFSTHLIDWDLSANNGGWQWSASTGTDAVPYFRIFNPITQSERFDPNGDFIRQFCPELIDLDSKVIHDPHGYGLKVQYPLKMVDYKQARLRTLEAFKRL